MQGLFTDSILRISYPLKKVRDRHTLTLSELVKVFKSFNPIPENLLIYGIEGRCFEYTDSISKEVREGCYEVADEIKRLPDL